jgi:hypothetical protein
VEHNISSPLASKDEFMLNHNRKYIWLHIMINHIEWLVFLFNLLTNLGFFMCIRVNRVFQTQTKNFSMFSVSQSSLVVQMLLIPIFWEKKKGGAL